MMISQYFTAEPYPTRRASQPSPHFPEGADARDMRGSRDRLAAVCESHKFVPVHCSQAARSGRDRLRLRQLHSSELQKRSASVFRL